MTIKSIDPFSGKITESSDASHLETHEHAPACAGLATSLDRIANTMWTLSRMLFAILIGEWIMAGTLLAIVIIWMTK